MTTEILQPEVFYYALTGLLLVAGIRFGFTKKQRDAIVQRDTEFGAKIKGNKGGCQAPFNHRCNGDKGLHVHHIRPVGYCDRVGVDPNFAMNGISICSNSHISEEGIHPDTAEANKKYRAGNKKAYDEMMAERREKLDEHTIYWDAEKGGRRIDILAVRNTQKAEAKGWKWPWSKQK